MPANATAEVISCPLDNCEWAHTQPVNHVPEGVLADVFGTGVVTAVAATQRQHEIEHALSRHFATHKPEDYLRTITRLRNLLRENGIEDA